MEAVLRVAVAGLIRGALWAADLPLQNKVTVEEQKGRRGYVPLACPCRMKQHWRN